MGQRATHSAPRRRLGAANDPIGDSSHHCAPARVRCEPRDRANSGVGCGPGGFGSAAGEHAGRPGGAAGRQAGAMCRRGSSGVTQPCASQWARLDADAGDAKQRRRTLKFTPLLALWGLAVSGMFGRGDAMQANNGGALVLADSGRGGPMSSPAYANTFETWNTFSKRTSTSPVTFRLQAETKFGWEVCVTGGCEALGYWDPDKALLLRTDPSRYPIWEGIGQLPGGCDIEYKYLMRPRGRSLPTPHPPILARMSCCCSEEDNVAVRSTLAYARRSCQGFFSVVHGGGRDALEPCCCAGPTMGTFVCDHWDHGHVCV